MCSWRTKLQVAYWASSRKRCGSNRASAQWLSGHPRILPVRHCTDPDRGAEHPVQTQGPRCRLPLRMVATIGPIPVGLGTFEATSVGTMRLLCVSLEAAPAGALLMRGGLLTPDTARHPAGATRIASAAVIP